MKTAENGKRKNNGLKWLHLSALALLFTPFLSNAQSAFVNRGASVYIQNRALVKVVGDFTNSSDTSSGLIINDGTIEVTGNFENKTGATFKVSNTPSTERAVKFVGSGTQLIKGDMNAAGQASFYNLVIDKVAASDTVEMQASIAVEGSLVFGAGYTTGTYNPSSLYTTNNQKGLLKTYTEGGNEYLLDIQEGSADAIAGYPVLQIDGAPTTGFILTSGLKGTPDGGLQRKIGAATSYVFPIGTKEKGFNGVRLNFVGVPGDGSVKTKFCDGSSNVTGHVGILSPVCTGCTEDPADNRGYNHYFASNDCNGGQPQWVIFDHTASNHGYWSFESTNTGYQYDMEVFPNSFGDVADQSSSWRVIKHEGPYSEDPSGDNVDWTPEIESLVSNVNDLLTYTKNAGCYSGDGVPGGLYTDFSHFTMGMSSSGNALPVKFIYVKAEPAGKHYIKVSWATAIEVNNAGFEVLRSEDGVNFTKVGWVAGHNNSTQTILYSFDDRVNETNVAYYYKLKQIDNDQKFEYSNVVQAKLVEAQANYFNTFPNPTAGDIFVTVQDPQDEIKVVLYDTKGSEVYQNIFVVEQNGSPQTVVINASTQLPPGTYLLNISTNGIQYQDKVILQH